MWLLLAGLCATAVLLAAATQLLGHAPNVTGPISEHAGWLAAAGTSARSGPCHTSMRTGGAWPDGLQGEVRVTTGARRIRGWNVTMRLADGQSVREVWNGSVSVKGSAVTIRNLPWNGALAEWDATTFGFVLNGEVVVPTVTCASL